MEHKVKQAKCQFTYNDKDYYCFSMLELNEKIAKILGTTWKGVRQLRNRGQLGEFQIKKCKRDLTLKKEEQKQRQKQWYAENKKKVSEQKQAYYSNRINNLIHIKKEEFEAIVNFNNTILEKHQEEINKLKKENNELKRKIELGIYIQ